MKKHLPEFAPELVVYLSIGSILVSCLYYLDLMTR